MWVLANIQDCNIGKSCIGAPLEDLTATNARHNRSLITFNLRCSIIRPGPQLLSRHVGQHGGDELQGLLLLDLPSVSAQGNIYHLLLHPGLQRGLLDTRGEHMHGNPRPSQRRSRVVAVAAREYLLPRLGLGGRRSAG